MQTTTNQALFRIEAGVCKFFRDYLTLRKDLLKFTRRKLFLVILLIISSKHVLFVIIVIISFLLLRLAASEGGANVFKVSYFKGKCTELKTTHTPAYALMVVFRGVDSSHETQKFYVIWPGLLLRLTTFWLDRDFDEMTC